MRLSSVFWSSISYCHTCLRCLCVLFSAISHFVYGTGITDPGCGEENLEYSADLLLGASFGSPAAYRWSSHDLGFRGSRVRLECGRALRHSFVTRSMAA